MAINKKNKSIIAIYAIITVVFTIITLFIPFKKNATLWIMFAFTIVALIISFIATFIAFKGKKNLMSKFYGFPIFRIGYIYALAQLTFSLIIYTVGTFVDVPYWVSILVSVILSGIAGIGLIVSDNARDIIENIDANSVDTTREMTKFSIDISEIIDNCEDQTAKELLVKLAEKLKYSDPVSSLATADKEKEISSAVEELKQVVLSSECPSDELIKRITRITKLLSVRNRICFENK